MRIQRPARRRNAILLTSLVDVMFVLLFFFMLVTRYDDWRGWSMALAGSQAGAAIEGGALILRVQRDGGLMMGDQRLSMEAAEALLRAPGARAVLVAEAGVNLQTVIDALDRLKPSGAALSLGRAAPP